MEILVGARDGQHLRDLRGLLGRATTFETRPTDYEEAAALHRACRRGSSRSVRQVPAGPLPLV